MIEFDLDQDEGILTIRPDGPLSSSDFKALSKAVDSYVVANGALTGVMIVAESFPGWEDLAGLLSHLRFVRDSHQDVSRVAAVTDSKALSILPRIIDHFVSAKVRHFGFQDQAAALTWLRSELTAG